MLEGGDRKFYEYIRLQRQVMYHYIFFSMFMLKVSTTY